MKFIIQKDLKTVILAFSDNQESTEKSKIHDFLSSSPPAEKRWLSPKWKK